MCNFWPCGRLYGFLTFFFKKYYSDFLIWARIYEYFFVDMDDGYSKVVSIDIGYSKGNG